MHSEFDDDLVALADVQAVARAGDTTATLYSSEEFFDALFSDYREVPVHSSTDNLTGLNRVLKGQQPSTRAVTGRSTYVAPAQPIAEADFSDDLLKVEDSQPVLHPSPRLEQLTQIVADLRQSKPFRKYKDKPAVMAASVELVQSMLAHIEREVAGA